MNKIFFLIVVLIAAFGLANGQMNATCMHTRLVTPHQFFEVEKALGTWYPVERYSGLNVDAKPLPYKCLEINLVKNGTSGVVVATESYIDVESGVSKTSTGVVEIDGQIPAIWLIKSEDDSTSDSVWLQTDYENWAVQFGCFILEGYRYETFFIWSRTPIMDPRTLEVLRVLATGYGFPPQNIQPIETC